MVRLQKTHVQSVLGVTAVFLIAVVLQLTVSARFLHNDRVVVWVFDVGQGDAIFIDAPNAQILIDGGRNAVVLEKLAAVMPFWDRDIDYIVNTHPHADHVSGLNAVLERYTVHDVWTSGQIYETDAFVYFTELTKSNTHVTQAGEVIDLGQGATLTLLWPQGTLEGERLKDPNAGSIVAMLEYGDTTMLFPGDAGKEEEQVFLRQLSHIDVLKVPHQGSLTSSSPDFLDAISPDYAVIPVGENTYGHPSPIVVDRYRERGVRVLRTDQDGDVRIVTDGGEPSVSVMDL